MQERKVIRELAINRIKEYKQSNPFNSETSRDDWTMYNVIYQHEIREHLKTVEFTEYYQEVFKREKSHGQLSMI